MMSQKTLQTKAYIFLVLMMFFGSVGNVLLRIGMKRIGEVKDWSAWGLTRLFVQVFTSGWIWLGICGLLMFMVCFLVMLTWADYSYVFPVSGIGYALVTLLGYALLGEVVNGVRWTGVACICVGVTLVGRTPPRTTGRS
jgi:drug/metabolite transporter (DMT)-like permease